MSILTRMEASACASAKQVWGQGEPERTEYLRGYQPGVNPHFRIRESQRRLLSDGRLRVVGVPRNLR